MSNLKICTNCIYDETTPSINFDDNGVCNYCLMIEQLVDEYGTGSEKGKKIFESILEETWNPILVGIFALIKPVITSTEGRCVARIR